MLQKNDLEVQIRVIHKVAEGGIIATTGIEAAGLSFENRMRRWFAERCCLRLRMAVVGRLGFLVSLRLGSLRCEAVNIEVGLA